MRVKIAGGERKEEREKKMSICGVHCVFEGSRVANQRPTEKADGGRKNKTYAHKEKRGRRMRAKRREEGRGRKFSRYHY